MAEAARKRGYEYIGISDHSQSLKIARGVSVEDLWAQIKYIDKLNGRLRGFRILKSSEVDILADGSLDYPDDLLAAVALWFAFYNFCRVHKSLRVSPAMEAKITDQRLERAGTSRSGMICYVL
jgi:DNA polymerase (family 10)